MCRSTERQHSFRIIWFRARLISWLSLRSASATAFRSTRAARAKPTATTRTEAATAATPAGHLHEPIDGILTQLLIRGLGLSEQLRRFGRPRLASFGKFVIRFGNFFFVHRHAETHGNKI